MSTMKNTSFSRQDALAYADRSRDEYQRQLKSLVEIPTVSAQREHKADIRRGVDAAAELLKSIGATVEVIEPAHGEGNPIVHGRLVTDPSRPTVTVYNHLDVQPADRERDGWTTDPFQLTIEGDVYRGRGTTD